MKRNELEELAQDLKSYPGILRKKHAVHFKDIVGEFFGEDGGFISLGDNEIVFTADGIWHEVLEKDLFWGGFVSILVNIHDIYAMGAKPVMAVNVITARDIESLKIMKNGIKAALDKFSIKLVKGHVHPDEDINALDVAMIGIAKKGKVIRSTTAREGDRIIVAVDTDGKPHEKLPYNFDTTFKPSGILKRQFESMVYLAENELVSSGKDISNAGILGTVAMLLEASRKGGFVDIEKIPKPGELDLAHWLKSYPACGFVVTTQKAPEVIEVFKKHGLDAKVIGIVDGSRKFRIRNGDAEIVFYDFRVEGILSESGIDQEVG